MRKLLLTNDQLAQLAHVGWAAALTLILALWFRIWICGAIVVAAGVLKEFVVEPLIEDPGMLGSSWEDFSFWANGVTLAMLSLILKCYVIK
jgi:hypothetical protein